MTDKAENDTVKPYSPGLAANPHKNTLREALGFGADISLIGLGGCCVFAGFCLLALLLAMTGGHFGAWLIAMIPFALAYHLLKPLQRRAQAAPVPSISSASLGSRLVETPTDVIYDYDHASIVRQGALLGVPGTAMFVIAAVFPALSTPLTAVGIVMLMLAFLVLLRLAEGRTAVKMEASVITVKGLIGEDKMCWIDVQNVYLHKFFFADLPTLFSIGTTLAIVIESRSTGLGGSVRLLIPVTLLGLSEDQQARLISQLVAFRDAAVTRN